MNREKVAGHEGTGSEVDSFGGPAEHGPDMIEVHT